VFRTCIVLDDFGFVLMFYSFFLCFGLVLYWMILDLYWTCGELDVLLQGFCNILNLELFWRLPVRGGSQNSHYIKKPYNTFIG
jgi:hypothetical protein